MIGRAKVAFSVGSRVCDRTEYARNSGPSKDAQSQSDVEKPLDTLFVLSYPPLHLEHPPASPYSRIVTQPTFLSMMRVLAFMTLGFGGVAFGANGPKAWKGVRYTPKPHRFQKTFPNTSPFDTDLDYSTYGNVCPQDKSMIEAYGLDVQMDEVRASEERSDELTRRFFLTSTRAADTSVRSCCYQLRHRF